MINKIFEIIKVILMCGIIVFIIFFCAYSDTHYTREGFISHGESKDLYIFTDFNGHMWEFTDENIIIPYNTIVKATARMFTNNTTENIKDDIILEMKIDSLSKNKK